MATMCDQWDVIGARLISIAEHGKLSMNDIVKMAFYAGGAGVIECICDISVQNISSEAGGEFLESLFDEIQLATDDIIIRNPNAAPEKDKNQ